MRTRAPAHTYTHKHTHKHTHGIINIAVISGRDYQRMFEVSLTTILCIQSYLRQRKFGLYILF